MKLRISYSDNSRISKELLSDLFEHYGVVNYVKVFKGLNSAQGTTIAIVFMKEAAAARKALNFLNGKEIENSILNIEISNDSIKGKNKPFQFSSKGELKDSMDNDLDFDDGNNYEEEERIAPEPFYLQDDEDNY